MQIGCEADGTMVLSSPGCDLPAVSDAPGCILEAASNPVEIALTDHTPSSIDAVLAENRAAIAPARATTAVFYSISNCQEGLRGISFGNFLIKQVVEDLQRELPNLQTFVTLSPIPGFARWLRDTRTAGMNGVFDEQERAGLQLLEEPA